MVIVLALKTGFFGMAAMPFPCNGKIACFLSKSFSCEVTAVHFDQQISDSHILFTGQNDFFAFKNHITQRKKNVRMRKNV